MPSLGVGSGCYLVEVREDAELGAHLWYGFLELLNPLLLLCFLCIVHCPLTLKQTGYYHIFKYYTIIRFRLFSCCALLKISIDDSSLAVCHNIHSSLIIQ